MTPGSLRDPLKRTLELSNPGSTEGPDRIYLEEFQSFRSSIAWEFNRLYWQRLKDWENATGKSYEKALPGGKSDGNRPEAITDSVSDLWARLQELDSKNQLPAEIFLLEIGVGMGIRAGMFLIAFAISIKRRVRTIIRAYSFLLGDYSLATLERSRPAVQSHVDLCSFIALDALDPLRTLSFLRHKILYVHLTNTYDNLPDEEVVWRNGRIYWVQVRAYISAADAARIGRDCDVAEADLPRTVKRLLEVGAEALPDRAKGMRFWMEIWNAMRTRSGWKTCWICRTLPSRPG